ncbi:MAG TPA: tryptophanase [Candidatus Micrarchaeaceae archaeon]|nr:tryptophanase [Candidatus Micrarchaeaceae archaeon]
MRSPHDKTTGPDSFHTIIEPFKIKTVEPIRMTSRDERAAFLKEAGYNLFRLASSNVLIDLLTDSGTGAMSSEQWAGVMRGDEAYAGSSSFYRFEKAIKQLTGFKHVIPTHQGRAAERILFSVTTGPGKVIPGNHHFDTTRANIEVTGAEALDLPCEEAADSSWPAPFKGNIDLKRLKTLLQERSQQVPMCILTLTDNTGGGQPVSLQNLRDARALLNQHGVPLILDAARFAENAMFIKMREPGNAGRTPREIAREQFSYADGCLMSAKKDGMANIGGFLALNNDSWAEKARQLLILTEGFTTYGGLAGRDLEAIAQGLEEVLHEDYLRYRLRSAEYLGAGLRNAGIPIVEPPGGHAVYIDARAMLSHLPPELLPGQALSCALYIEGGVRSIEVGTVMFGRTDPQTGQPVPADKDLVRLALPRRVYTQSHVDYVIEVAQLLARSRTAIGGYRIVSEPAGLRHFTAVFAPIGAVTS